jgi:electron transfer flavoprotein alpha subunit
MSILIYAESADGKFKKVAFEIASYAKKVADMLGTTVTAVSINATENNALSAYGVSKVLKVTNDKLTSFNAKAYADVIKQAAEKEGAKVVILASTPACIKQNLRLSLQLVILYPLTTSI